VSWIDALLVTAGLVLAATGRPLAGVPLVALGLVLPGLRLSARRRSGRRGVLHLVPPDVAAAYADVRAAASLEGVPDGDAVIAAADDALLEMAAVLAGRPPKGAAQHRLGGCALRPGPSPPPTCEPITSPGGRRWPSSTPSLRCRRPRPSRTAP
jgi:hypothetical protein